MNFNQIFKQLIKVSIAFIFTLINFAGLYFIVRAQLKKEQQKFAKEFSKLDEQKVFEANFNSMYQFEIGILILIRMRILDSLP